MSKKYNPIDCTKVNLVTKQGERGYSLNKMAKYCPKCKKRKDCSAKYDLRVLGILNSVL